MIAWAASSPLAERDPYRRGSGRKWPLPRWLWVSCFVLLLLVQLALGLQGIANYWQWGHNGYNGAAYLLGAKNSLRWNDLLPAQYASGSHKPNPDEFYTHAPLGLHLSNVVSVAILGDHEYSIRIVACLGGVFATAMLLIVVKRRWGDLHAVLAGTIYVLLPINHGFANMTNHETWCIGWSLAMLACYLAWLESAPASDDEASGAGRRWWWVLGFFVSCFFAVNWNWPAYYICFAIALHWFYASFDVRHRRLPSILGVNREHVLIAAFSVFVLLNFFGHFYLVYEVVGSFDEMKRSFETRSSEVEDVYSRLWKETLEPMFSAPVLALSLLWTVVAFVRQAARRARHADLIIVCFAFSGFMHIALFKQTALVHIYWPWQWNPFVALACAVSLLAVASGAARWVTKLVVRLAGDDAAASSTTLRALIYGTAVALVVTPFLGMYLTWTLPLIPEGRRMAGTFNHRGYDTDYEKILFARKVREWTELDTGVLFARSFAHRVEVVGTMDRVRGWTSRVDRIKAPGLPEVKDGWVVVGEVKRVSRSQLLRGADKHPYRQYGRYFMLDFRTQGRDIEIYQLAPQEPDLLWWFFVNHHEPPMTAVRDHDAEKKMTTDIERLQSRRRPAPKEGKKKLRPVVAPTIDGKPGRRP